MAWRGIFKIFSTIASGKNNLPEEKMDFEEETGDRVLNDEVELGDEEGEEVLALPLPHLPFFPGFHRPVQVKDPKLLAALQESYARHAPYVGAFLVKDEPGTDPSLVSGSKAEKNIYDLKGKELLNRLYEVGIHAKILGIRGDRVVLVALGRIRIMEMVDKEPLTVKVGHLKDKPYNKDDDVIKATSFEVKSTLSDVLNTRSYLKRTCTKCIDNSEFPRLADLGAVISGAKNLQCQQVLEELDVYKRLKLTLELLKKSMEISKIPELVLETDSKTTLSAAKFRERLEGNRDQIPLHVLQVINEELSKLQQFGASSIEFNETHNYLDWLTALPWGIYSDENFDVFWAKKILDEDNYGLADVKERILEFIAVGKHRGTTQGRILCFSGPPGVGKMSIGRSIARALNRKFYSISVGGLTNIAEIKGHFRINVSSTPGKMVQCLKTVGTANPLVLIDGVDKLGRQHARDLTSAVLDLLDPEQNAKFVDNYFFFPIDLSKVLFVCTADVVDNIPKDFLYRMELISIAGYVTDEKMHIARDYLEKSTREACGIKPEEVEVTDAALLCLIEKYCHEAGVQNLQKHIEKIYHKIALQLGRQGVSYEPAIADKPGEALVRCAGELSKKDVTDFKTIQESEAIGTIEKVVVDISNLADFVGDPVFNAERIYDQTPVGVAMGLAWTAMGGSTLYIKATQIEQGEGKGALTLPGQLGDVMKGSAQLAHIVARSMLFKKEPDNRYFANSKLYLHVPLRATPMDEPSAGCTMITSLLSLAMKKLVKKDLAITGEFTLLGKILPIGWVKEKTIAARRNGVKTIIFPSANKRDFDELATNVKEGLDVHFVDDYNQIFDIAFGDDQETGK
ncbi:lon protease homolog, mitochondrial-like isoform X1 [Quercus lobata]|uniref:lon protease homolog, mitochondrial-like isoform X1 n=1 Tax=Quercus lobata TaxID=97700 RepID=UPI001243AD97|nr:lon protease homolog, mitochondrial-like isoform X1 [Quercus lobata]